MDVLNIKKIIEIDERQSLIVADDNRFFLYKSKKCVITSEETYYKLYFNELHYRLVKNINDFPFVFKRITNEKSYHLSRAYKNNVKLIKNEINYLNLII